MSFNLCKLLVYYDLQQESIDDSDHNDDDDDDDDDFIHEKSTFSIKKRNWKKKNT